MLTVPGAAERYMPMETILHARVDAQVTFEARMCLPIGYTCHLPNACFLDDPTGLVLLVQESSCEPRASTSSTGMPATIYESLVPSHSTFSSSPASSANGLHSFSFVLSILSLLRPIVWPVADCLSLNSRAPNYARLDGFHRLPLRHHEVRCCNFFVSLVYR